MVKCVIQSIVLHPWESMDSTQTYTNRRWKIGFSSHEIMQLLFAFVQIMHLSKWQIAWPRSVYGQYNHFTVYTYKHIRVLTNFACQTNCFSIDLSHNGFLHERVCMPMHTISQTDLSSEVRTHTPSSGHIGNETLYTRNVLYTMAQEIS